MSDQHDDGGFNAHKATPQMDRYSRQIGTYGVETMKNLVKLDVLLFGLTGVGIETAKNLCLAGIELLLHPIVHFFYICVQFLKLIQN